MSEGKHTPLPWYASPSGWTPWDGAIGILPADQGEEHPIAWTTSGDNEKANAELIVRAVNSHQMLVEALERIAAIENKEVGLDWEEIEEARHIARMALASAAPPVESKSEVVG